VTLARPLVVREWQRRTVAEYRSAVIAHEVTLGFLRMGAPPDLVRDGLRIVDDELHHSELSTEVAAEAAGESVIPPIELESLPGLSSPRPGDAVRSAIARFFCIGETVAVPLFHMLRANAEVETARKALDVVLGDEARHRRFGWDVLDWLLTFDEQRTVEAVGAALPALVADIRAVYRDDAAASAGLADEDRRWGLAPPADYVAVVNAALADDVLPRFAARGISLPS
jgi:hypothetical protein